MSGGSPSVANVLVFVQLADGSSRIVIVKQPHTVALNASNEADDLTGTTRGTTVGAAVNISILGGEIGTDYVPAQ